jgi:SAM-dependent methyltransferase
MIALTLLPAVSSLAGTAAQIRSFSRRKNALVRGANGHVQRNPNLRILNGVARRGGLIVCVGGDDPQLLIDLGAGDNCLVQGIDPDAKAVEKAREHIRKQAVYGKITAQQVDGSQLPYIDNLVNAIVIQDTRCSIPDREIARVLAPRGVVLVPTDFAFHISGFSSQPSEDGFKIFKKPVPSVIDDWTHYLHSAGNNAVSHDRLVDQPFRIQWTGAPRWARHHDYLAGTSALVAAGGHNPLEAAAVGVPILFGPHMEDFAEISRGLLAAGGARSVANSTELAQIALKTITTPPEKKAMGKAAKQIILKNQGVVERHLAAIEQLLSPRNISGNG